MQRTDWNEWPAVAPRGTTRSLGKMTVSTEAGIRRATHCSGAAGWFCCEARDPGSAGCGTGERFSGAEQHDGAEGFLQHPQVRVVLGEPQSHTEVAGAKPTLIATARSNLTTWAAKDCMI